MSPEKMFVCHETYLERYMFLRKYEQDGKWIVLHGDDIRTGDDFTVTIKIWDELMPVCKREGFKRAGKYQDIDSLVDRAVLLFSYDTEYHDYNLFDVKLHFSVDDDDESVFRFSMCDTCLEEHYHNTCPLDADETRHPMILESCVVDPETRKYKFGGIDYNTKEMFFVVLDEQTAKGGVLQNSCASKHRTLNDLGYHYNPTVNKVVITFMVCPEYNMVRIVEVCDLADYRTA